MRDNFLSSIIRNTQLRIHATYLYPITVKLYEPAIENAWVKWRFKLLKYIAGSCLLFLCIIRMITEFLHVCIYETIFRFTLNVKIFLVYLRHKYLSSICDTNREHPTTKYPSICQTSKDLTTSILLETFHL